MRKWTLGASLGLSIIAAGGLASAQPVAQPSHNQADLSAFHGSPETIQRMIARVEAVSSGRVIEIRFAPYNGDPGWFAAVDEGGQIRFVRLSREEGELVQLSDDTRPTWMLRWRNQQQVDAAEKAKVSLPEAIQTAEKSTGDAPAVAAGIATSAANDTDVKAYNILILAADGSTRRIAVDSQTGEVIADPSTLENWP